MKLVNYRCEECGADFEELFRLGEEVPQVLEEECPECGSLGTRKQWNFKNNDQVQKFDGQW